MNGHTTIPGLEELLRELKINGDTFATKHLPGDDSSRLAATLLELVVEEHNARGSAGYESLRTANWAENVHLNPFLIIRPATTIELSKTMQILSFTKSKFSIRSGGHSPNCGWANVDDGILVDLGKIDDVTYNSTDRTAIVGTGAKWQAVYETLEPHGVVVVGGRVMPVGVGGLILGGGLSYITNEFGLAADNVVAFEVVLAAGDIVTANAESNSDLFWALKGGGGSFGIVTRFTLRTYPMGMVWGGIVTYEYKHAEKLMQAVVNYQLADHDKHSDICVQFVPSMGVVFTSLFYTRPIERPDIFSMFLEIPSISNTCCIRTWSDYHSSTPSAPMTRWGFRAVSLKLDKESYANVLDVFNQEVSRIREGLVLALVVQPISKNVVRQGKAKGGNPLGLEDVEQIWLSFSAGWTSKEDDQIIKDVQKSCEEKIAANSKKRGAYLPYLFMNDAAGDQDVLQSYRDENHAKLKMISAKYDTYGVLQTQAGGYGL